MTQGTGPFVSVLYISNLILKETTAYLQSDEFKAAAQSILDNPNASDSYKDCVRRSLKKVEDYFSNKQ